MNRRQFLTITGVTTTAFAAGCSELSAEVNGRVRSDGEIYNLDVEAGETIEIEVENDAGLMTFVMLTGADDELIIEDEVETEHTFEEVADQSGVYRVEIYPDTRASVTVWVD